MKVLFADDDVVLHRVLGHRLSREGFTVLQEWKRRPGLASIPVIMLTARNREGDVIGALEQGAVDYLTKPFSPAELIARIRRFIPPPSPSSP